MFLSLTKKALVFSVFRKESRNNVFDMSYPFFSLLGTVPELMDRFI
jgi:hypothetical protein